MGKNNEELENLKFDIERNQKLVSLLIMLGLGVYCGHAMGKVAGAKEARESDTNYKLLRRLAVLEDKAGIETEGIFGTRNGPIPVRVVED